MLAPFVLFFVAVPTAFSQQFDQSSNIAVPAANPLTTTMARSSAPPLAPRAVAAPLAVATPVFEVYNQSGAPASGNFSQPRVVDLDGDGNPEIIATTMAADPSGNCHNLFPQGIYVWDQNGMIKPGFPVLPPNLSSPPLCGYLSIPSIGNVTGGADKEIVVTTGRSGAGMGGGVFVLSPTGAILRHILPSEGFSGVDSQRAVLVNLDADPYLEILAKDYGEQTYYAWNADGTSVPGWPIVSPSPQPLISEPSVWYAAVFLNVWPLYSGTIQSGVLTVGPNTTFAWWAPTQHPRTVRIGDVTGDSVPDLVAKTASFSTSPDDIRVLNLFTGQQIAAWPSGQGWSYGQDVTLGDVNGDGRNEILYHDDHQVYAKDYLGNSLAGFPRSVWQGPPSTTSPCGPSPYCTLTNLSVADLDGDGKQDIYAMALWQDRTGQQGSHQNAVFAINGTGQDLRGFPLLITNQQALAGNLWTNGQKEAPTFADLDGDGVGELVLSSGWGRLHAYRLNHSRVSSANHCAPQYGVTETNQKWTTCP